MKRNTYMEGYVSRIGTSAIRSADQRHWYRSRVIIETCQTYYEATNRDERQLLMKRKNKAKSWMKENAEVESFTNDNSKSHTEANEGQIYR
eukprot:scaffold448875_cov33-Prasinocladus_malaysianus.AAC.1